MKTFHVKMIGNTRTKMVDFPTAEAAKQHWDNCYDAGTTAIAFYMDNGKKYDLFTDELITEQ